MSALTHTLSPGRPEHRLTVEQYLRMVQAGILTEKHKVELLNGRIVEKMARNPPHDSSLNRLTNALLKLLPEGYILRSQSALRLPASTSVPEPDIAIVRGPAERYDTEHPGAADVLLVVEVADSSLPDDRGEKLALYALGGIPLYWIVNLVERQVEIYSQPAAPQFLPDYRSRQDFSEEQSVSLPLPDGQNILLDVRDILPRPRSS